MKTNTVILVQLLFMIPVFAYAANDQILQNTCREISEKLASVGYQECLDRELQTSDGFSTNNKPILIKQYPPSASGDQPLGKVLLIGGMHGDEYSTVTMVFKWMRILDQHHTGEFYWKIAPLLNPDGLLQDLSQRLNANGVDLDRNFPSANWNEETLGSWENNTPVDPLTYPGESPLSEAESRWLDEQINTFNPDVIVVLHASYTLNNFGNNTERSYKLVRLHTDQLATRPGSLSHYAGVIRQIPVLVIELPYADKMPGSSQINTIWLDLVRWLNDALSS